MLKPGLLRAALTAAVPHLRKNPDKLHVFVDEGRIRSTLAGGLSFEYGYTLNVIVTDFADHADTLIVPILAWLRDHQPDMLQNPDLMKGGFTFEADILKHGICDISIKLKLTERVRVTQATATGSKAPAGLRLPGTVATITHLPEPLLEEYQQIEHWELYLFGEKVQEWDARPFEGPVT